MPSITITAEALRELHRIHRQLADLHDRLDRGPRSIRAGEAAVVRAQQQLAELKDDWKKMRMSSDAQHLQLKQREAKIADLERKLNECKTNTEFKLLKEQIAAERQANAVLEDEILEKLERLDTLHVEMEHAEAQEAKSQTQLQETQQRIGSEHDVLQSELARVTEALERAEQNLPGDFRPTYQRLVRAHGAESLAPVDGDTCGGCNTMLTTQTINELYMSRAVFCKSCGCVLYLPEGRVHT